MNDAERSTTPINAVHVTATDNGDEYYKVGFGDVTAIEWGVTNGSLAEIQTVRVFKNGHLHSEHPFPNVLSVYYDPDFQEVEP